MIDWLKRDPARGSSLEISGRSLPVAIRRNPRARRMTLRLAPDGSEVRMTVPLWCPTGEALAFARSRSDWIAAQLAKVPEPQTLGDGATFPFRGSPLTIRHRVDAPRSPRLEGDALHVGGPQSAIEARLKRWLRGEAQALLAQDLAFYCARAGAALPALALSNAQRRWGSCSPVRAGQLQTVRINWRLVMAPDMVRRSVVAHEVAHLAHFDHSPRFHAALAAIFEGDLAAADAWLKREGRCLYGPFG